MPQNYTDALIYGFALIVLVVLFIGLAKLSPEPDDQDDLSNPM